MISRAPTRPLMEGDETKQTARTIQRAGNFGSVWLEQRQTRSQLTQAARPRASVGFNDFWVVSYARRRPTSSRFPQGSDSNLQIRNPINKLSGFLVLLQREKLSDQDQPSHHYHRSGKHRSVHATPQSQTPRFTGVVVGGAEAAVVVGRDRHQDHVVDHARHHRRAPVAGETPPSLDRESTDSGRTSVSPACRAARCCPWPTLTCSEPANLRWRSWRGFG